MNTKFLKGKAFQYGLFLIEYGFKELPEKAQQQVLSVSIDITTGGFTCPIASTSTSKQSQKWT